MRRLAGRSRGNAGGLALACAQRDMPGIELFRTRYLPEFDYVLLRFPTLASMRDDLRQRLCDKFFVSDPPGLLQYTGRGPLGAWVRASATRMALNAITREMKEAPMEQSFFDAVVGNDKDAEALYLKTTSRASLQAAFERAAGTLDARERNLLKFALIDHLNVDEIAAVFCVHRATAARWVASARTHLVQRTHAELMAGLNVSDDEAASIVRAGLSGIGLSFLRNLGEELVDR
jgi:RNA polymerase sigma-70 factor, ECF subfamily